MTLSFWRALSALLVLGTASGVAWAETESGGGLVLVPPTHPVAKPAASARGQAEDTSGGGGSSDSGPWSLVGKDAGKVCRVTLTDLAGVGGFVVEIVPSCARHFSVMNDVVSWQHQGDMLLFKGNNGKALVTFATGPGGWVAKGGKDGIARLQRTRASVVKVFNSTDVAGSWNLVRSADGKGACAVDLRRETAGSSGRFVAELRNGCTDTGILDFTPTGWAVEDNHLLLTGRDGSTLSFAGSDGKEWVKDPAYGKPLMLRRVTGKK